jgi:hypothetical protein
MPSVGVQLSRVCPVCVPAPPGAFLPVLYRYCRLCGPCASLCVRVSRPCVPGVCPGLPTVSYRVRVRYSAVYFLLMSKTVHRGSRDTHGTVPVHPPVSFTGTVHQPGTGTGNSPISHATRHSRERGDGGPHVYQATCCDPATMPTRTSHADQVLLAHGPKCATVRAVEDAQRDIWFTQFKQRNPSPGQLLVCSWQVRRAMGSGSAP